MYVFALENAELPKWFVIDSVHLCFRLAFTLSQDGDGPISLCEMSVCTRECSAMLWFKCMLSKSWSPRAEEKTVCGVGWAAAGIMWALCELRSHSWLICRWQTSTCVSRYICSTPYSRNVTQVLRCMFCTIALQHSMVFRNTQTC